jgi:signal peptidase II
MLWFPFCRGVFPNWLPVWGGDTYEFFRPVFNIADTSISVGVFIILIFQRVFFKEEAEVKEEEKQPTETAAQEQTSA